MDDRLFINLSPGSTYLDKLTGKTKVRLFFAFIILLIATWDMRIIFPTLILTIIGLSSLHSKLKSVKAITIFVVFTNLLNLFLIWIIEPDYGATICGGSTVLFQFTPFYIVTGETMWYFLVRFCKMMATFVAAMTFIQSITPSELAAGLYANKIPYKVCMIVSIAFRYIPDILRDFQAIKISMQARGMELDAKKTTLWTRLKQNVLILVPLIVTSFDRVGNIANAMDLRGFGKNKTRTYYAEHEDGPGDRQMKIFYIFLYLLILVVIAFRIFKPSEFEVWYPWS
ncbi:MAG: energy-coupling factor transporter transmembrane protein EcfT [Lachnospiraceae bacterium]|nr:energy-coupling factor transporter transmembrane protein EcfT [Lachnospiraceae bacterium]